VILQTDNDKVQANQDIAEKDGKYYKTGGAEMNFTYVINS